MNYTILKAELAESAYDGMTDTAAAAELNVADKTVNVTSITGQELFEAVVEADYAALDTSQRVLLMGIVGMGTILVNATNTKAAILSMFGPGTDTRANLGALQTEQVSRAAELLLPVVRPGHVAQARAM